MAFLYPNLFPICVKETDSDPEDILLGDFIVYPKGMTLKQAMALVWKPASFKISGSSKAFFETCEPGGNCDSAVYEQLSGSNVSTNVVDPKMSDLICPRESYNFDYVALFQGTRDDCTGPVEHDREAGIGVLYGTIAGNELPVYLYEDKYYVPFSVGCFYNSLFTGQEVGQATVIIGDQIISGIPLRAQPGFDLCDSEESLTLTMDQEREYD